MKKAVLLSILGVMLLASKSDAQHFVTSFGVHQSWGIPYEVYYTLEHQYCGYDIVHASHIIDRRQTYFEVVLQRGDTFVRLNLGRGGRIFRTVVSYDYPLFDHRCNDFCGFHPSFYNTWARVSSHGHRHIAYTRPATRTRYVYRDDHGHHNKYHSKGNRGNNRNGRVDNHHWKADQANSRSGRNESYSYKSKNRDSGLTDSNQKRSGNTGSRSYPARRAN